MYQQGLIWVITGNGKGKTTSAIGQAIRTLGHGMTVAMIQFMKGSPQYGEFQFFSRLNEDKILWRQVGRHEFVSKEKPEEIDLELAAKGWELAKECLDGRYNLVILDELNVALDFGLLDSNEIVQFINSKPSNVSLILTGRYAPQMIKDIADTVSIIAEEKHHYNSGVEAQAGMEY